MKRAPAITALLLGAAFSGMVAAENHSAAKPQSAASAGMQPRPQLRMGRQDARHFQKMHSGGQTAPQTEPRPSSEQISN